MAKSLAELSGKEEDGLQSKRDQVNEYLDNSREEREWAELHRDYFDDKQWTASEISALNARGQPVITDNKIKDKVEYMEGVERKTRTDPKAFPRTPVHEEDADVATDAIRYVFDENDFPMTASVVFQNLLVEGFGGCEVIPDKDDPKTILIRKIRWDRLYRDPYSMEGDCSDASYLGIITWMDQSRAKHKWPTKKECIDAAYASGESRETGETTGDKPRWVDTKRKRVQVFEHYEKRDGKVYRSVFCWGGFLEPETECPYVDDEGKHEWPIIVASAYIDREGRRYGLVKRYISLQDEVNKRRSKSLHLLNSVFLIMDKGAIGEDDGGVNGARKEVSKPDGAVQVVPGMRFEIERNLELSAGHFQLLQQAENALSVTGPNAALQGNSGAISGRAKQLDQEGGAIAIGVLFDTLKHFKKRVARAVWNRIRQYWDEEMMIRVTDSEHGIKFVTLNRKTTAGEVAAKRLKAQQIPEEQKVQALAGIAADPDSMQPEIENSVADLDVDIVIDESPDVVTLQAEEFEQLAQLAGTGAVPIPPDALIEASGLRAATKKRVMDILKGTDDPAAAMQAQFQQMMQQLEAALKGAQVQKTEAETALTTARAGEIELKAAASLADATEPRPPEQQPGSRASKAA
jgi:hypothetical protein